MLARGSAHQGESSNPILLLEPTPQKNSLSCPSWMSPAVTRRELIRAADAQLYEGDDFLKKKKEEVKLEENV